MFDNLQQFQQLDSSEDEEELIVRRNDMVEETIEKQAPSLMSSITSSIYNLRYNLLHTNFSLMPSLQRPPIHLQNSSSEAYLLGEVFQPHQEEAFVDRFQKVVWFSYRVGADSTGDVGWGCMIRVVQMLFAEAFQRHCPQPSLPKLIQLFKEDPQNIFSLANICKEGDMHKRWVSCNQVVSVFAGIVKNSGKKTQLEAFFQQKNELYIDIYHEKLDLAGITEDNLTFPKLVFISNQAKKSSDFFKCYPHFKHLMKLRSFCGAAGGIGNDALYIVGCYEDKAIILDPHYVQEQNNEGKMQFFKKTPRGIGLGKLSSNFSLSFYLQNIEEYRNWVGELLYLQKVYSPFSLFPVIIDNAEQYEKHRKTSQDFQML